jgi:hypothetical protein
MALSSFPWMKFNIKNPTSLSRNGVSISPYHAFPPPRKGIRERISGGIIAKWKGLSTSIN